MRQRLRGYPRGMLVAAVALGAGGAILMCAHAGFNPVAALFEHIHAWWLAVAFGAQVLAFAGYALAYHRVVATFGGPRLDPPLVVRMVASGFGAFAPGGGFEVDYRAIRALGQDQREAVARVLALGALEYVVIAPAACLASIVMLASGSAVTPSVLWPWAVAVPVGSVLGFWASARSEWIVGDRSGRLWRLLADSLGGIELIRQMAARPRKFLPALLGIGSYWAGEAVCLWASLETVGATLPVGALVVGLATGHALTRRSMPLAGAGVTEVLLSFALVWVGVDLPSAVAGVVVYRLRSFILPMLPGLWGRQGIVDLIQAGLDREVATRSRRARATP